MINLGDVVTPKKAMAGFYPQLLTIGGKYIVLNIVDAGLGIGRCIIIMTDDGDTHLFSSKNWTLI